MAVGANHHFVRGPGDTRWRCSHCGLITTDDQPSLPSVCPGPPARQETEARPHDPVNHPAHYNSHPSGVECKKIARHFSFCRGSALKYIWRAGLKGDEVEDLRKAIAYLQEEIDLLLEGKAQ